MKWNGMVKGTNELELESDDEIGKFERRTKTIFGQI
jgi:hypothetical protein